MDNSPLLLGQQAQKGDPMDSFVSGFQLTGADQRGQCITTPPSLSGSNVQDLGDPVIKFNTDVTYGCQYSFATFEKFK